MSGITRRSQKSWCLWGPVLALMLCFAPSSSLATDLTIDGGAIYAVSQDLNFTNEYIGNLSSGTLNQSGYTNAIEITLVLGNLAGSRGIYDLSGGNLVTRSVIIGNEGEGNFIQRGGTNAVSGNFTLGNFGGSKGVYNLTGGANTVAGILFLGFKSGSSGIYNQSGGIFSAGFGYIGHQGIGEFNQSDGITDITYNLQVGYSPGVFGTYNLSGGTLSASTLYVGKEGIGIFNQSGGSTTIERRSGISALYLGYWPTGSGTYNLSGGTLTAPDEIIGVIRGVGVFNQSSGANQMTGTLELGNRNGSRGTYNLSGGTLTASTEIIGYQGIGVFNQSGGANLVSGDLALGYYWPTGNGTYNLSGGSLTAAREYLGDAGTGVFNHTGGSNMVDSLTISPNGAYNLSGTGMLLANFVDGNLTNGGMVNPGHPVGTMTVNGSYTQTANGTLAVEIASPTSYDNLNVIGAPGTATLNGTLKPILLNGYIPQSNQVFPGVVAATGGVTGTFSTVGNFTPTLMGQALYGANRVDLVVQRNYVSSVLAPLLTGNQYAVGVMLNGVAKTATGDLNTILHTIDALSTCGEVAGAYRQITPEKAAAFSTLAFAGANLQNRVLSRRITDLRFGGRELEAVGGLPGSINLNYSRAAGLLLAYNSSNLAGLLTSGRKAGLAPEGRWSVYLDPALVLGGQRSGDQTGFDFNIVGFNAGSDCRVRDDLLVGLATGYSHTNASFHGPGGVVGNNTWPLTAYAAYLPQSFYAYGSLGYALNLFNLERQIAFGSLYRRATSSPTGNQFNAYGEAGYDLKFSRLVVTPVVSLAFSSLWVDGFTESGAGALNLKVSPQNATSLQTGVGGKIALPIKRNSVVTVPQIYATYQHEHSDSSRGLDARLSQGGSTFTFQTEAPPRNFAVAGANVTILTQKNLQFQLDYNAEVGRSSYTAHYVSAGVRWQF